jgi:predicted MFS family arabinose efflux permease
MELSTRYWGSFAAAALICVILQALARSNVTKATNINQNSSKLASFQMNYIAVFLLAMFSDWLQGPYVYELYVSYGFSQVEIAELFVCGFASSMIVGTFVGGLADTMGRKLMCIAYCVCYILACFTKMVPDYWTLMLGRFLSGIATSLLFSVFESWMVCEHFKNGFDSTSLGDTFAYATFGNGLVAVIAGLVANSAAQSYGYVAPFVVAILPLTLVGIIIYSTWSENYGNQQLNMLSSLQKGFELVKSDSRIAALAVGQSCFEGAMYTFVFMWTPALKSSSELSGDSTSAAGESTSDYLGLIFAVYMVCVMCGSSLFKLFSTKRDNIYLIPVVLHSSAFLAMVMITLFFDNKFIVYLMFLVFESTVGLFYPSYGVIKSEKIPEDIRSAVMNIFRIPLNAFVVFLLLKIKNLSPQVVFSICACTHFVSLLSYLYFYFTSKSDKSANKGEDDEETELIDQHA